MNVGVYEGEGEWRANCVGLDQRDCCLICCCLPITEHRVFRPNSWLSPPPSLCYCSTNTYSSKVSSLLYNLTFILYSTQYSICTISDWWSATYVIISTVVLWNSINQSHSRGGRWLVLLRWRICQNVELLRGFACQIWPYLSLCCDSAPSALSCHRFDCFRGLLGGARWENICQAL